MRVLLLGSHGTLHAKTSHKFQLVLISGLFFGLVVTFMGESYVKVGS